MFGYIHTRKKSDKYKYVYRCEVSTNGKTTECWLGTGYGLSKMCDTENQAAKWVDVMLINKGKKPVNVLKPI